MCVCHLAMPTLPLVIDLAMPVPVNCTLGGHEGSRARSLLLLCGWGVFLRLCERIGVCLYVCVPACVGRAFVFVDVCLSGSKCVCVCVCVGVYVCVMVGGSMLTAAVLF